MNALWPEAGLFGLNFFKYSDNNIKIALNLHVLKCVKNSIKHSPGRHILQIMNRLDSRIVLKVVSRNLFILAGALLFCTGVSIYFGESYKPFLYSFLIAAIPGVFFFLLTKKTGNDVTVHKRDAYVTVTVSWLVIAFIGCLPYIFSGSIPDFSDAFFESVSGFTTTGSSILEDIESLPKSILFWRSLTHWIGGIGIIVLVIVVMPALHLGGYHLFTLESSLQEKIQPKIKSVGLRLLYIYLVLTLAETLLLRAGHMTMFDSICHSFGTVATGGFSPRNTSIAEYSPYIQYVIMIFMLLAGTNFVVHYFLVKRKFNRISNNEELKFYLLTTAVLGLLVTGALYFKMHMPFEQSFRSAFFQVISIVTCTGFATADYLSWPVFAWVLIFFAMFLGGSTGSTAGGIKMVRHLIVFKNIRRVFRQLVSSNAVLPIKLNKSPISDEANNSILTFVTVYIFVFLAGSITMVALGLDDRTAVSSVATCMAGIGPGLGTVGPVSNFAHLSSAAKLILTFLMLIGRLEIYTILSLFTRSFWSS